MLSNNIRGSNGLTEFYNAFKNSLITKAVIGAPHPLDRF